MSRSSSSAETADPWRRAFREALPGRLRSIRWPFLAALLLVAVTLSSAQVGPSVQAQSVDPVLVSNTGQAAGTALTTNATRDTFAQSFTTGSHPHGYFLSSVDLGLAAASGVTVEVSLWSSLRTVSEKYQFPIRHSGHHWYPSHLLTTLTAPSAIDTDGSTLERFSAHDVLLYPDTTYWIVVSRTAGADGGLTAATAATASAVDSGGMAGFALGRKVFQGVRSNLQWDADTAYAAAADASLTIGVRGTEATRPPGPYVTNRNAGVRAAPAETGSSLTAYATSFTPGSDILRASGATSFQLTSVLLSVAAEDGVTPRVRIHADDGGSPAADPLANGALTTTADISRTLGAPGRAEFTANTPITVSLGTTYWVVVDVGSGMGKLSVGTTTSGQTYCGLRDTRRPAPGVSASCGPSMAPCGRTPQAAAPSVWRSTAQRKYSLTGHLKCGCRRSASGFAHISRTATAESTTIYGSGNGAIRARDRSATSPPPRAAPRVSTPLRRQTWASGSR